MKVLHAGRCGKQDTPSATDAKEAGIASIRVHVSERSMPQQPERDRSWAGKHKVPQAAQDHQMRWADVVRKGSVPGETLGTM